MAINFSDLGGGGGGKFQKTEIITATQSWTVPADVDQIEVWVFGGGGAGAPHEATGFAYVGGGGGGGGCGYKILSVTPGSSHTVTIGAGGAGVAGPLNSNTAFAAHGATSSFGALVYGYGGQGGSSFPDEAYVSASGTASTTTSDGVGSGGGRGNGGVTWYVCGGGGGGAGGPATMNEVMNSSSTVQRPFGTFGQGWTGALGDFTTNGTSHNTLRAMGGPGIMGYGGGGGGAIFSNDFTGIWATVYAHLRYRGKGNDGGGNGARGIYNGVGAGSQIQSTAGAANTGGGGGAGGWNSWYSSPGANGGSGVVVIKYWTAG